MMRLRSLLTIALATLAFTTPAFAASDHLHHSATVHIDPARAHLKVEDTLAFKSAAEITLRLSPAFTVDTLTVNGQPTTVEREGSELIFRLDGPGPFNVKLSYQGQAGPLLSPEGGIVEASWLAHPQGRLATWTIEGQIPAGQKFIVPGRLLSEAQTNDGYQARFENRTPSDLPVLITGPFEVGEKMLGNIRLRTYFHAELAPQADAYLEDTARYVAYYIDKVGPYPYPGFSIISGPAPVGWGLPGMTYMGRRVLALPFIRHTSLPHEILHNWWGNAVEVDYQNGNWAEGLTTYQADHAIAERRKTGGGQEKRLEWLRNFAALPAGRDHALTDFRSKTHDASQVVGYGKTAFVFHMLSVKLGPDVFDKAIQRFGRDNLWAVAGWPEIQAAFETESGQDLSAFFKAWVERPGAPVLTLSNAETTADHVRFTLNQDQDGASYPLTVPVEIETPSGPERHNVELHTKSERFMLNIQGPAKSLRADPTSDVFRRLSPSEAPPILRDVTLNPDSNFMAFGSPDMRDAAYGLARQLLQSQGQISASTSATTAIIAGARTAVRQYLKLNALPATPEHIQSQGDARAWVARAKDGRTVLVIEAEDVAGINALARVLPHYKRRSYVVMKKAQTIDKGTWEPEPGALTVRLD